MDAAVVAVARVFLFIWFFFLFFFPFFPFSLAFERAKKGGRILSSRSRPTGRASDGRTGRGGGGVGEAIVVVVVAVGGGGDCCWRETSERERWRAMEAMGKAGQAGPADSAKRNVVATADGCALFLVACMQDALLRHAH